ncbi:MAG: AMP-binding protein [Candidatus Electrothrix sp. YB6]
MNITTAPKTASPLEQPASLNELIDIACTKYADHKAVGMALHEPITYREFHARILALSAKLQEDGVQFGDRVALLAENSCNWVTAYLAVVRLGAVCVPILPDLPEADVQNILSEMECSSIFTSKQQINKILGLQEKISLLVTLDDYQEFGGQICSTLPFTELLAEAQERFAADLPEFPAVESTHTASILYTSGSSGFAKAVVLSHGNFCANAAASARAIPLAPGAVFLSILPVSHTFEFTVGFLMPMLKGACVCYAGKSPTPTVLKKLCRQERPHLILTVPLVLEKIYKKQVLPAVKKNGILSFLCRFSLGRRLIYRRIGKKLMAFFGGRLEMLGIGGAALNPEVEHFLRDARLPYLVGYGMTEASPVISGGPAGDRSISPDSAGKPLAGVEVRIEDADPTTGVGEILVRGPNVMQGYWNKPDETAKTIDGQGWLHTGDLGRIDEQGNVCVTGRSKSVIVLANGENVYPEAIEHKLNSHALVAEALVVERDGALVALIHPDYDLAKKQSKKQEQQTYLTAELERIRREVNGQVGSSSRLAKVAEQQEPFIKTATHKIKRYLYAEGR